MRAAGGPARRARLTHLCLDRVRPSMCKVLRITFESFRAWRKENDVAANDHHIGTRHEAEASAIEHLWPHSNDLGWDEYTERRLRVFASGQGSTLTDVQGRSYLDGLAGLVLVNVGHGRAEIAAPMAEQAGRRAHAAWSNS